MGPDNIPFPGGRIGADFTSFERYVCLDGWQMTIEEILVLKE